MSGDCLYHPCKLHKAVDAMSCSEGHCLETLYLHAPFLMVVYAEVSILVVRRSDWNLAVSTFQIISLCKKTGTFVTATASPKVVLDQRTKGVNHVEIDLAMDRTAVVDSTNTEVIYHTRFGPLRQRKTS